MKAPFFLITVLAFVTALAAFRLRDSTPPRKYAPVLKSSPVIRCSPDWAVLRDWLEASDIPPIPGAGSYQWKISTTHDSAQFYFNQGINMYYGFHIIEAMASFKKAIKFDGNSPMLFWAQALAYGPNINDYGYRASPEALSAVEQANYLAARANPFERELIKAMSFRYTADSADVTRARLNQDYTDRMKEVAARFPNSPDAQALYADAMMLQHPWDLWKNDGSPKPWTPAIRSTLEKLLARYPMHPGANHYYIHVMEASPYAGKALPSAYRLGKTNPGLSHLVHMPSHIYLRTGHYRLGVTVNDSAVSSYGKVLERYPAAAGADFLYVIHNLHMKANNAMLTGNRALSLAAAQETRKSIPDAYFGMTGPLGNYLQYISMTPVLARVRFAAWDDLLNMSPPDTAQVYSTILYHFGKGMALAALGRTSEAEKELSDIRLHVSDSSLREGIPPFSPSREGAAVAESLLAGSIARAAHRPEEAIAAFKKAVETEENMVYDEPRDWMLSPRHFLAQALLETGRFQEAEACLRKDLKVNAENGWALQGIAQALEGQGKKGEALRMRARAKKAFSGADVKITGAVM